MLSRIALLTLIMVFLLPGFAQATGTATSATTSAPSRAILDEARALGTENRKSALTRLEKIPKIELIQALREGLAGGEVNTVAEAASSLQLHELSPDLEKISEATAVLALRSIVPQPQREATAARLLAKARTSDEFPYRNEIYRTLGVWHIALSDQDFERGLKDPTLEVRAAIVDNFLSSRSSLTQAKQIQRFRESFKVKPAQVRLQAMIDFEHLSSDERTKLASALDEKFAAACKAETNADVKLQCERLQKLRGAP